MVNYGDTRYAETLKDACRKLEGNWRRSDCRGNAL